MMFFQNLINSAAQVLASVGIWGGTRGWIGELVIICCASAAVAAGLIVWARYFRRKHRRRHHRHSSPSQAGGSHEHESRRKRRRRRAGVEEMKRNATLAETGGLPRREGFSSESSLSE